MDKTKKFTKKSGKKKIDIKSQINNEIIQAQGKFKQAKIGTIRKLVQKLKHPEKNPKQNRAAKAERYQNILNEIKHMSPKRLGLLALFQYKSGKNYLADPASTIQQLTVAYYLQFKGLDSVLDSIRKKVHLDDASNWRQSVKKLFKKKNKTKKLETDQKAKFVESDGATVDGELKTKKKNAKVKIESNGKLDKSNKSKKQTKQKPNNDGEQIENDESSDSEGELGGEEVVSAPTAVDDFFITADGSNYLSTAIANPNQDENDTNGQSNSFDKKQTHKQTSVSWKGVKKPVKLGTNRIENTKRTWTSEGEERIHEEKRPNIDPKLHPSWQAKQKLKPIITEFKGKKITFD